LPAFKFFCTAPLSHSQFVFMLPTCYTYYHLLVSSSKQIYNSHGSRCSVTLHSATKFVQHLLIIIIIIIIIITIIVYYVTRAA